jgi:hypothetical protein
MPDYLFLPCRVMIVGRRRAGSMAIAGSSGAMLHIVES